MDRMIDDGFPPDDDVGPRRACPLLLAGQERVDRNPRPQCLRGTFPVDIPLGAEYIRPVIEQRNLLNNS